MRYAWIFISGCLCLSACKSGNDNQTNASAFTFSDGNDAKLKDLTGAWYMDSLLVTAKNDESAAADNLTVGARNNGEGSVTVFGNGGAFTSSNPQHQAYTKWAAAPPSAISLQSGDNKADVTILDLEGNNLSLSYTILFPDTRKAAARVSSVYHKLKTGDESSISWTDPGVYSWRISPKAAETDAQVAARVKSLLNHNYLLANALYLDSAQSVNTNKFYLPFEYYQGAVALQRENAADERFANLFYSADNAHKGFEVLRAAFKKVNYKKTGNYIQEYANFFRDLAAAIP